MSDRGPNATGAAVTVHNVVLATAAVFLLLGGCLGQAPCSAEVKLLLRPEQSQLAVTSLRGGHPTAAHVFFYDTEAQELKAHGVILRVRQGAASDLTVKLRVPDAKAIAEFADTHDRFKCEVDRTGDTAAYSYSVRTKLAGAAPTTGADIERLLSDAQRQLLRQAGAAIEWSTVKRVADIRSTSWTIKEQPLFDALVLELWEWANGSALEISTRSTAASLQATYDQLRSLVAGKGLTLNSNQQFKTDLVMPTKQR